MKVIGDPQRVETRLFRHPGLADQFLRGVLLGGQKVSIAAHGSASSCRAGAVGGATGIASRATRPGEGYSGHLITNGVLYAVGLGSPRRHAASPHGGCAGPDSRGQPARTLFAASRPWSSSEAIGPRTYWAMVDPAAVTCGCVGARVCTARTAIPIQARCCSLRVSMISGNSSLSSCCACWTTSVSSAANSAENPGDEEPNLSRLASRRVALPSSALRALATR